MEGNQETYEVLSAALSFHQAVELAKADKKIDLADLPLLLVPLMKLPPAISGIDKCLTELKSMNPTVRAEMLAKLGAEYDIADDVLEYKVEAAIDWLASTGKFVGVLAPNA